MIDLYEHDFVRWTEEQARAIREGRLDALDREHLAEEIESMGNKERRELAARLTVLVTYLLKQRVQPELSGTSWRRTVRVQRRDIGRLIKASPSLKPHLEETLADVWEDGIKYAELETGIYADRFELELITLADALGEDFDQLRQRRRGGRVREQAAEWRAAPSPEAPVGGGA